LFERTSISLASPRKSFSQRDEHTGEKIRHTECGGYHQPNDNGQFDQVSELFDNDHFPASLGYDLTGVV
jgi:hypothetical protein